MEVVEEEGEGTEERGKWSLWGRMRGVFERKEMTEEVCRDQPYRGWGGEGGEESKKNMKGVALQRVVSCRYLYLKCKRYEGVVFWSLYLSLSAGRYLYRHFFSKISSTSFAWMPEMQQQAMEF